MTDYNTLILQNTYLKSPSITSQEGEEAERFIHQTLGTEINESEYLLSQFTKK